MKLLFHVFSSWIIAQIRERVKDAAVVLLLNQDVLSNGATKTYLHVGAVSIRDCALSFFHTISPSNLYQMEDLGFGRRKQRACSGCIKQTTKWHRTNNSSRLVAPYCPRSWVSRCHSNGHRSSAAPATNSQPPHPFLTPHQCYLSDILSYALIQTGCSHYFSLSVLSLYSILQQSYDSTAVLPILAVFGELTDYNQRVLEKREHPRL